MHLFLANVGVPMIFIQLPALIITLPAVILVETLLFARITKLLIREVVIPLASANLMSTFIGFPMVWIGCFALQILIGGATSSSLPEPFLSIYTVTAQAAWLVPYDDKLYWMVPTAMLVLLIPAFFMSVFLEFVIVRRLCGNNLGQIDFLHGSWIVYYASYSLLLIAGVGLLIYAIITEPIQV